MDVCVYVCICGAGKGLSPPSSVSFLPSCQHDGLTPSKPLAKVSVAGSAAFRQPFERRRNHKITDPSSPQRLDHSSVGVFGEDLQRLSPCAGFLSSASCDYPAAVSWTRAARSWSRQHLEIALRCEAVPDSSCQRCEPEAIVLALT